MKKTIAILLVAILAVSSVFAAFSGEAKLGFGGNLDNGNFGFIDKSADVKFDLELATADAESVGEGDVYASIKATFALKLSTGEKKYGEGDPYGGIYTGGAKVDPTGAAMYGTFANYIIADITEAKVGGENWYVSLLGIADAPNYAESAIDTYTVEDGYDKYGMARDDFDKAYNYGVGFEKAPGVEVSVYDYKVGFGLLGDYNDDDNWKLEDNLKLSVFAETPEYDFNGLTLQAGAVYSYSAFDKLDKGAVLKYTTDPDKARNAIGVSAKVGFANDTLSASVATDMGFNLAEKKAKDVFDMDIAANFGWSFLTVDGYYGTYVKSGETPTPVAGDFDKTSSSYKENVLSFQAKFDLNTFDVPVAITASVKDVMHTVELGVKAEVTAVENLKITASAGYVVNTVDAYDKSGWMRSMYEDEFVAGYTEYYGKAPTAVEIAAAMATIGSDKDLNNKFKDMTKDVFLGQWKVGLEAEYDFGFAKVAAGISAKNLGFKAASADKAKLDPRVAEGAKDKTGADETNHYVNQVLLGLSASISTESIIPGAELKLAWENADDVLNVYKYDSAAEKYNFGKITASCKIAF